MPAETSSHKVPYPLEGDSADIPRDMKALALRLDNQLDAIAPKQIIGGSAGKLLIVDKTGATAFAAMKGDGTIDGEGNFQLGADVVGAAEIAAGAVGESEIGDGALSSRKLKPTAGIVTASAELTLATTYADITGAKLEITPSVPSLLLVTAVFDFELETVTTPGAVIEPVGSLKVDSEPEQSIVAIMSKKSLGTVDALRNSSSQVYALSLSAATHTIKMRAKKNGEGTGKVRTAGTRLSYVLLSS